MFRTRVCVLTPIPKDVIDNNEGLPVNPETSFSRPGRLRHLFLAGERCDVETLEWAKASFGVPVLDHWWQTGEQRRS